MSDLGDLFTSFYNQFVLRDLLSMVLPGLTVIFVYSLFLNGSHFTIRMFRIFETSWLSLIFVLVMSYFIGVVFIGVSDCSGWFKTYYTDSDPVKYQKRTKEFIDKIFQSVKGDKSEEKDLKAGERFFQIKERYIVFTQTCGNFAWACITSWLIILISDPFNFLKNIFPLSIFCVLFVLSCMGYREFQDRQIGWDNQFTGEIYLKKQSDSKLYALEKLLQSFMSENTDGAQLKRVIGFYILVGVVFAVLVVYLWWMQGQPSYYRDAGIAVVGGFSGSLIYGVWEKIFVRKKETPKQQ